MERSPELVDLLELHFFIVLELNRYEDTEDSEWFKIRKKKGLGGQLEMATDLTFEFNKNYQTQDGEWQDAIEAFLESKMFNK